METQLLHLLQRKDYTPLTFEQLSKRLQAPARRAGDLHKALRALEKRGEIVCTKGKRYIKAREADLIAGVIRVNRQGRGYVRPDDPGFPEIVVPESATSTALHGDRVLVRRDVALGDSRKTRDAEVTGVVVRILERKRKQIVGTLQRSKRFLYVIPDDPRLPHDIYVPPPRDVGRPARVGDKVVVELRDWESRHTNPEGDIVEVLGAPDEEGVDLLSVIREYELSLHFPKPVLAEADVIARRHPRSQPDPKTFGDRQDCRQDTVITIDPDDAKDFDDAISVRREGQDTWRVWVHIADVSHFVRPGSALDLEARHRGNSTYLVDRVIPMLPEALSNELCSLNPGVDRLTKCVEATLSRDAEVTSTRFYSAVIRSHRRLTYGQALEILGRRPADAIERMLHQAHELGQRLRRQRMNGGALSLDFPETKIRLDNRGRILRIDKVESDVSHQLIEEFMLLANEAVAAQLRRHNRAAIYRVHEPPNERRLREFREEVLQHHFPCGNLARRAEVQALLEHLDASPIGPALKIAFLRSLMRARYAVEPLGHYGLNKKDYTHFTSPIRRYADLAVHRALFEPNPAYKAALQEIADHISATERNSDDAERDSKEVKLFAFLKEQLRTGKRQPYPALVTQVRNFGFFIDVPDLGLGGLVHLSSMEDDFYVLDAGRGQLTGRRTRRVIKLGSRVVVEVAKVDTYKKQVDFRLKTAGRLPARSDSMKARFLESRRANAMRE